ncbi:MAG TPA: hypothetical protein ENI67_04700 [Gammaproteobacteria bacterium]|nr:hypothetical protein [Gammaproteobacteria bacterium]
MSILGEKYSIAGSATKTILNGDSPWVSLDQLITLFIGVTGAGTIAVKIKYLENTTAITEATVIGGSQSIIIDVQNVTEIAFTETSGNAVVVSFSGE